VGSMEMGRRENESRGRFELLFGIGRHQAKTARLAERTNSN